MKKTMLKTKKLVSLLAAASMAASALMGITVFADESTYTDAQGREFVVWDGTVDTSWYTGETDDYYLDTPAKLAGLRNLVWDGNNFSGKRIHLQKNMDFKNLNWKYGIGGARAGEWASGVFSSYVGQIFGDGYVLKNISIDPSKPDASGGSAVSADKLKNNVYLGFIGYCGGGTTYLCGINLENVTITLPSAQQTTESGTQEKYFVGGLAAIATYSTVVSCTVKNIRFLGGWAENTASAASIIDMGGLIGNHDSGAIVNSYVNGVDYTGMTSGAVNEKAYKAALCCAGQNVTGSNAIVKNVYAVNMKYDAESPDMLNYDTVIYCHRLGNLNYQKYSENNTKNIYTDKKDHKRTAADDISYGAEPSYGELFVKDAPITFENAVDGEQINYTVMLDLRDFGIQYPVTGAERIYAIRPVLCGVDGQECKNIDDVKGKSVTLKFYVYNSLGEKSIPLTALAAGSSSQGLLETVAMTGAETVTVAANPGTPRSVCHYDANRGYSYIYGPTDEKLTVVNTPQDLLTSPNKTFQMDTDKVKVFVWDSLSGMKPLMPAVVISE